MRIINLMAVAFAMLLAACGDDITNNYNLNGEPCGGADDGSAGMMGEEPVETAGSGGDTATAGAGGEGGDTSQTAGAGGETANAGSGGESSEADAGAGNSETKLFVSPASSTPTPSIVLPPAQDDKQGWNTFTRYTVTNGGDEDALITEALISQTNVNGTLADFQFVSLNDSSASGIGTTVGISAGVQGGTATQEIWLRFGEGQGIIIPAYATHTFVLAGIMSEPVPTWVQGRYLPRSGDTPNLQLSVLRAADGTEAEIKPYTPYFKVLRKALPIITWEEIAEPFQNGMNTLARITISSSEPARPVGFQQLQLMVDGSDPNVLAAGASQMRLLLERPETGEAIVWEADPSIPADQVGGHVNADGVAIWEEAVPDIGYLARLMLYRNTVATPEFSGLAGPVRITLQVEAQGVQSGMTVTTRLKFDRTGYPLQVITTRLSGFDANGLLATRSERVPWPYESAGLWWTDLSEGTGHRPMDWMQGAAESPIPSSPDYTDEWFVPGIDGSSTLTAP